MACRITFEVVDGALCGRERSIRVQPGICLSGNRIVIEKHDIYLVGRAADCHIRLPEDDPLVSRHHFLLECAPPRAVLRDLGSLHGTVVNQTRYGGRADRRSACLRPTPQPGAAEAVALHEGDQVKIGRTTLRIGVEQAPASPYGHAESAGPETLSPETGKSGRFSSPPAVPHSPGKGEQLPGQRRVCWECGGPVAESVKDGPARFVLCEECRRHSPKQPAQLAAQLRNRAEAGRSAGRPPTIPGYRLLELLGQGGSGSVYRALETTGGDAVAIKVLKAERVASAREQQEFLREVEMTRSLVHPHIVRLLGHGVFAGGFYLVMEYCDAGNAEMLVNRWAGAVPPAAATRVILETLEAVAWLHSSHQVHRDIKPANILLLNQDGRQVAKLADLGLAKDFRLAGFSGMTIAGQFAGTYEFMPREQLTGFRFMKPSSDVWSLAATYYYLLSGAFPCDFSRGRDKAAVVLESTVVPIGERGIPLPAALAEFLARALSPDPEHRFADAVAMRDRLLQIVQENSPLLAT